jgi:predicted DsbA family dithiol-disulfide isomerase
MQAVPAVVVSDFSSPFCWLAEAAMRRLRSEGLVSVGYHALELYPAETPLPEPHAVDAAVPLAAELGLELRRPSRAVRTRKAHELARLARAHGCEDDVRERIFAAYFSGGENIGRIDVLVRIGQAAGLDLTEVKVVLDVDTHAAAIQRESELARQAGLDSAPIVVLGSGAQRARVDGAFALEAWREMVAGMVRANP